MREIKFRVWDKKENIMLHFKNFSLIDEYSVLSFEFEEKNELCGFSKYYNENGKDFSVLDDVFELMQFTGLLDKNGKEVYEGDVVRYDHFDNSMCNMVVSFYRGQFTLQNLYRGGTIDDEHYQFFPTWDRNMVSNQGTNEDMEIIGNLYENPELLSNHS